MKFEDFKGRNGTSIKSYVEVLVEEAKTAGLISVIVLVSKEHKMIHAVSTMDGSPARALIEVGRSMLTEPETVESEMISPNKVN